MGPAAHDVISTCPVCAQQLAVTRLHCGECGTTLEGRFSVGRFGRLDKDQLALLESFLRARGNLRDMERELGISYPTVRNRVESLVRALGLTDGEGATRPVVAATPSATVPPSTGGAADAAFITAERRRVLERLARKELTPEDAASILRALGGTEGRVDA